MIKRFYAVIFCLILCLANHAISAESDEVGTPESAERLLSTQSQQLTQEYFSSLKDPEKNPQSLKSCIRHPLRPQHIKLNGEIGFGAMIAAWFGVAYYINHGWKAQEMARCPH